MEYLAKRVVNLMDSKELLQKKLSELSTKEVMDLIKPYIKPYIKENLEEILDERGFCQRCGHIWCVDCEMITWFGYSAICTNCEGQICEECREWECEDCETTICKNCHPEDFFDKDSYSLCLECSKHRGLVNNI